MSRDTRKALIIGLGVAAVTVAVAAVVLLKIFIFTDINSRDFMQ